MFRPENYKVPPELGLSKILDKKICQKYKQAGNHVQAQEASAAFLAWVDGPNNFQHVGKTWRGEFLKKKGMTFVKTSGGDISYFLSLGYVKWVVFAMRMKAVVVNGQVHLSVCNGRSIVGHAVTKYGPDAPIKALPTQLVPPGDLPEQCAAHGLNYVQEGEPIDTLTFAIKSGVYLSKGVLQKVCRNESIAVPRATGQTYATHHDYGRAVIKKYFPGESSEFWEALLFGIVQKKLKIPAVLSEKMCNAVASLDGANKTYFQSLEVPMMEQLQVQLGQVVPTTRAASSQCPSKNLTHPCIRQLVPGGGELPRVYVVHQVTSKQFCAWYPPRSFARTWEGPRATRSEAEALGQDPVQTDFKPKKSLWA